MCSRPSVKFFADGCFSLTTASRPDTCCEPSGLSQQTVGINPTNPTAHYYPDCSFGTWLRWEPVLPGREMRETADDPDAKLTSVVANRPVKWYNGLLGF